MSGTLAEALRALLAEALPELFGGTPPAVQTRVASNLLELDRRSAEAAAGEPRADDQVDELPFDPANPAGPYVLTKPPYPGPRRLWLLGAAGARIPLQDREVTWDPADARKFTLHPRPGRDLTGVTAVRVLYGVTAVFAKVAATQTLGLALQVPTPDGTVLDRAEALAIAVIGLNRERLVDDAQASYDDGDYGADLQVKRLQLVSSAAVADGTRLLTLEAALELKATRTLHEGEGAVIEHVTTPGRPIDPDRPVDVQIDVDA
jgi:hypothetical protein